MSPNKLRARVVSWVVGAIIGLAFGLYILIGVLLWQDRTQELPEALWLAAGLFGGSLVTFLANSKGGAEGGVAGPLEVTAPPNRPLEVREADFDHRPGDLG